MRKGKRRLNFRKRSNSKLATTVTTKVPDNGSPVSKHGVSIRAFVRQTVGMEEAPSLIDKKYNSVATSRLNLEITSSGPNKFEVDLDPAPEK